ncbi:MAG: hypothetical protein HY290_01075, partial [Planctomycetia bacterium]|nr:hypothetical protein [Planctomycetia bacterium]
VPQDYAEAAKWYLQVPESAPQYLEAQLAAGNAWWYAFQNESVRPEAERKPKEELDAMVKQSQSILQAALTKFESQITPDDEAKLVSLTTAKANYAAILNGSGDYKGALAVLTDGKLSVIAAIAAPEGDDQKRPAEGGIKSRKFAGWVYGQVLLRSYVGLSDLNNARSAMKTLEKIVGAGGGGASVTKVYLDLGKELEKEVHRLQTAKDPRLGEVLKSFETFLEDMFNRTEGHDYNTLNWVADTYSNLGDGLEAGDSAKAESYFGKAAAAVQSLLDGETAKPGMIPAPAILAVKLKLVKCKRRQKSFDAAHQLIVEILKEKSRAIDVQEEAAQLFQDWGTYGGADHLDKFQVAILGGKKAKKGKTPEDSKIWGWGGLAEKLQVNLQTNPKPEYEKQYLDASLNAAQCWFKYAAAQTAAGERKTLTREALTAIKRPRALLPQLGGAETWAKYNTLYRSVEQAMLELGMDEMKGKEVVDLERTISKEERDAQRAAAKASAEVSGSDPDESVAAAAPKAPKAKEQAKPKAASGGSTILVIVLVLLAAGGGVAYYFLVLSKKAKPKARRGVAEIEDPFASMPEPPKVKAKR